VSAPTLFHVTHWKAGSTWIDAILRRCAPDLMVPAQPRAAHFLNNPIREGGVYPRVYVTREEFESVSLPSRWTRFVVVRDLRDTLISAYFSLKFSHTTDRFPKIADIRDRLRQMSFKEGLELAMSSGMVTNSAAIQRSWAQAGEPLVRYEDLLEKDSEILERILIDDCGLQVDRPTLRTAIKRYRFSAMTGGRGRGQEDFLAHQRKGVAGEWRHYLRGSLKEAFKSEWGELLIVTGYESDLDW
jgi:lipopolysaccharide transport system ATP-binding protein